MTTAESNFRFHCYRTPGLVRFTPCPVVLSSAFAMTVPTLLPASVTSAPFTAGRPLISVAASMRANASDAHSRDCQPSTSRVWPRN
jgi:hypothetical protein